MHKPNRKALGERNFQLEKDRFRRSDLIDEDKENPKETRPLGHSKGVPFVHLKSFKGFVF